MCFMSKHSMESSSSKNLAWVSILFLVWTCGCKGCIQEEKMGLLEFKAFVKSNSKNKNGDALLPSWVDNNISECCSWERVVCDPSMGRVKKLLLNDIWQRQNQTLGEENRYAYENGDSWLLNVSIFLPFEELYHLNLSANSFNGFIENKDYKSFFKLQKLEILDLGSNWFNETILKELSVFTISLKTLILRNNNIRGPFPSQELSKFGNLTTLDLSINHLNGSLSIQDLVTLSKLGELDVSNNYFTMIVPPSIRLMSSLKTLSLAQNQLSGSLPMQSTHITFTFFARLNNLEIMDLSYNSFSGVIPSSIRLMSSLKYLSLAYNNLNGTLPNQGLCQLNKLEELDLSSNFFQGILPSCLNSLTSLRALDLSYNLFSGNFPSSLLANITSLEYIDTSNNRFEGSFSFGCFANHSKLQWVIFGNYDNKFLVESEDSVDWVPLFQLKVLVLSNCNLTGGLPNFLHYQFKLEAIDLSHSNLMGKFPTWLLKNNTRLEYVVMGDNSLMGHLLLPSPNIYIKSLDISDNQFDGPLQENLADMIPNVEYLNLSNNGFKGILPPSVANLKYLWALDLSSNNFSGEVSKKLLTRDYMETLKLSHNKFEGEIFSVDFGLTSLRYLYLNNNHFTGTLSNQIAKKFWLLRVLDLSNNNMSGEIPSGIGNMTYLNKLVIGNNGFKGKVPHEISQLKGLQYLDASHNALSGDLPGLSTMENLMHLHLQGNMFKGSIPDDFLNSSSLLTLDMRDNKLSGSIPSSISTILELRILLLSRNLFSGFIPKQLCHLTKISLMDLSNNHFFGSIPSCIGLIRFGDIEIGNHVFKPYFQVSKRGKTVDEGNLGKSFESVAGINVKEDVVEFVTKYRSTSYTGGILDFMSGLDLSCNNLTGEIPHELGMLSWLHALNLSHNQLKGSIPMNFFNLSQIESLDLSHNQLSGHIPIELVELNFLSVFSVAHNNISGSVPDKGQFKTFGERSYEDNPFLCGQLLNRKCNPSITKPVYLSLKSSSQEKWYDIDHVTFFASFATSYVIILLAFVIILYVNPYWRRSWFDFIEECIYSCYYFACDSK